MDLTTTLGMFFGMGFIAVAIILGGAGFGAYVDIPSIIIVFGGTIAITIANFEGSDLKNAGAAIGIAFHPVTVPPMSELAQKLINYAVAVKKSGMMSIEDDIMNEDNPFFKEAFLLVLDNSPKEVVVDTLETKLMFMEKRHKVMQSMFAAVGGTAGSMGMLGTLTGLIAMLANLSDPSAVGPAMAVALLTTMYGAFLGTMFSGVIFNKLEQKHKIEVGAYNLITVAAGLVAADGAIGATKTQIQVALTEPLPEANV
jgi:chemotaxis protein MotA